MDYLTPIWMSAKNSSYPANHTTNNSTHHTPQPKPPHPPGPPPLPHRHSPRRPPLCDQAEGIRWYHRAAEAGSDAAMSRLAQIYEADKHYKEAARWYRRYAAERIRWRNQRLNW